MVKLLKIYRIMNTLSIDVAIGAMVGGTFFFKLLGTAIQPESIFSLGICVWIIYTADHLLDSEEIGSEGASYRHAFHRMHFRPIAISLCVAIALLIVLLFFIPRKVVLWGSSISSLMILYFICRHKLRSLKEFLIAAIYVAGIIMPSWILGSAEFGVREALVIIVFFLTAFINLIVFSLYDVTHDRRHNFPSFVTQFGTRVGSQLLYLLFSLAIISIVWLSFYEFELALIFSAMIVVFFILFVVPEAFTHGEKYRMVGDAVFFLPALYLL
jgi:hypothetical protein